MRLHTSSARSPGRTRTRRRGNNRTRRHLAQRRANISHWAGLIRYLRGQVALKMAKLREEDRALAALVEQLATPL